LIYSDASQDLQGGAPFGVGGEMDDGGGAAGKIDGNGADSLLLKRDEVRSVTAHNFLPMLVAGLIRVTGEGVSEGARIDGQAYAGTLEDGSAALDAAFI
jgi:hypothetical protein